MPPSDQSVQSHSTPLVIATCVLGQPCHVDGQVTDSVNLETGDHIQTVSINSIITDDTGQNIFPRMLHVDQFRELVFKLLASQNL